MKVGWNGARDERGAAIGGYMMLGAVIVIVAGLFLVVLSYAVASHRAAGAADLAALAGAGAASEGRDGCQSARAVAASNGGQLTGCEVIGHAVAVEVSAPVGQLVRGLPNEVRARATAQPVAP